MGNISWYVKYLVFPLIPFLLGALIRTLHARDFQVDFLSPSELTFSVAMLNLLMSTRCSEIGNETLRKDLSSLFQVGTVVFLALFACSIQLEVYVTESLQEACNAAYQSIADGDPIPASSLTLSADGYIKDQRAIRWFAIGLSAVNIPLAVFAAKKYDLQEP